MMRDLMSAPSGAAAYDVQSTHVSAVAGRILRIRHHCVAASHIWRLSEQFIARQRPSEARR